MSGPMARASTSSRRPGGSVAKATGRDAGLLCKRHRHGDELWRSAGRAIEYGQRRRARSPSARGHIYLAGVEQRLGRRVVVAFHCVTKRLFVLADAAARHQRQRDRHDDGSMKSDTAMITHGAILCRARRVCESCDTGRASSNDCESDKFTDRQWRGTPIAMGRTGEPAAPSTRSGRTIAHDRLTRSRASSPSARF